MARKYTKRRWTVEQKARRRLRSQTVERKSVNKKRNKARNSKTKKSVFDYYGWKCTCCGEETKEFLTIDHISGGGHRQRKELGILGSKFYRWLVKNNFPSGFRTLCMNCNFSLGHYGYCPHESE
jgi:predicted restriction endonuclease